MRFPAWEQPSRCTGGPQPGAVALMAFFVEEYGDLGGFNLGIYNCRAARGSSTLSAHGEGRACDCGFPVGDPDGDAWVKRLLPSVGKLGVQAIIYERVIYSAKSPGGRPYPGLVPHWDHSHVELTREAAQHLTLATIRAVLNPAPRKPGERPLRIGMKGADVRWLQNRLRHELPRAHPNLTADGYFGPRTKTAVLRLERALKPRHSQLVVDGVVGNLTWVLLDVKPTF